MRNPVTFVLIAFLASVIGSVASAGPAHAAEPTSTAKVVIIVGATHGTTPEYIERADAAYVEAIKYTPNVVKVYSPNATWSKVKSATKGANVVIYLGHGNGWPSPYTYDPAYKTKNGFGLNAVAGNGHNNNTYYGEPYVSTLELAPGALVLLHHLCYAAGNSEPGHSQPSKSTAKQRADNYGAGFLKAGVAAVIADGHEGPVSYLRSLFTTDQTLADLWRTQPKAVPGTEFGFGSSRTPGQTVYMNPKTSSSGFYRSFVGNPAATTTNVREGSEPDPAPPPPGAYAVQMVFTDLWDTKFAGSIQWIYDERITGGCTSTRYCPVSPVTRGQMAAFIQRAMSLPPATKDYFGDDDGKTFESAINAIAEAGLTGGCEPGRFCRDANVSRAQMAAFLVRALEIPSTTIDHFRDDDGSTLESAINAMAEAGLTGGCGGSSFCPDQAVSREQMAAFLVRAFKPS